MDMKMRYLRLVLDEMYGVMYVRTFKKVCIKCEILVK